jgi:hypothetical protein
MGYKIPDVKTDIRKSISTYLVFSKPWMVDHEDQDEFERDIMRIINKHFKKIER